METSRSSFQCEFTKELYQDLNAIVTIDPVDEFIDVINRGLMTMFDDHLARWNRDPNSSDTLTVKIEISY